MKLQKIKTEAEALAAIQDNEGRKLVELMVKDGVIVGLRVGKLHAGIESYNVLTINREVEHEEAKRHKLVATAKGFPPAVTYHEYSHERDAAKREYGEGVEFEEADNVPVLVGDDGAVIREVGAPAPSSDNDLPF